jgi:cold shock protein
MTVKALVREWHDDEGWGVVDAAEVPGGCWVSFAHVALTGHRHLRPGQAVALDWERAAQDGFDYRAVRAWPWGADPAETTTSAATAYTSSLTLTFDPGPVKTRPDVQAGTRSGRDLTFDPGPTQDEA